MRSVVGKILAGQVIATAPTPLNRIGSVTESGTVCTNLTFDYINGDYIKNMTIWTSATNAVRV